MPYLPTAQEWLTQSTLLLQARPTTTRITTRYSLPRTPKSKSKSKSSEAPSEPPASSTTPKPPPTATLTLKTYDPASGVTLKYQTNKAAEVGRLVQIMGRLGRGMAGLEMELKDENVAEKEVEESVPAVVSGTGTATAPAQAAAGGGTGQGGKKGKKKGKK